MKKSLSIVVMVCLSLAARADDAAGAYNPKLGAFTLSQSDSIEMTDEVVDIWNDRVSVTFTFTNISKAAQAVTLGFPVLDYPATQWNPDSEGAPVPVSDKDFKAIEDLYKFTSSCNGKPLGRKLVREKGKTVIEPGEAVYWFMATLSFKPGEKLKVTDTYLQTPDDFIDSTGNGGWSLKYMLRTGSSWAGPIRKATLRYHSGDRNAVKAVPTFSFEDLGLLLTSYGFSYEPTQKAWDEKKGEATITWELKDIEPSQDLTIFFYGSFEGFPPATLAWALLGENGLLESRYQIRAYTFIEHEGFSTEFEWARNEARGITRDQFAATLDEFYTAAFCLQPASTPRVNAYARYIVNGIHALHGYTFKDARWTTVFSSFPWYSPAVGSVETLTPREKEMMDVLVKYR